MPGDYSGDYILYFYSKDDRNHLALNDYNASTNHPAYVYLKVNSGTVVVDNPWMSIPYELHNDDTYHEVIISRPATSDGLVWLEFDWYPPSQLSGKTYTAGIDSWPITESGADDGHGNYVYYSNTSFTYNDDDMEPELMDPIFYPFDNEGNPLSGYIGIPYVAYQDVYRYNTSFNSSILSLSDQAGVLTVSAADSVQHGYSVYFETKNSGSSGNLVFKQWLQSNKVDIPAYHKIHDFNVEPYLWQDEQTGSWYRDTRFNRISWKIYLPHEQDIMDNDYFEVQRAYDSAFTNAQTIEMIPIVWNSGDSSAYVNTGDNSVFVYTLVDSNVTGNNTPRNCDSVYYRIRRVSSAVWGWTGHDYAAKVSAKLENRSASIYNGGSYVLKDSDFDNTHKMSIRIRLTCHVYNTGTVNNPYKMDSYWDPNATLYIKKVLVETGDTILIRVPTDSILRAVDTRLYSRVPSEFTLIPELVLTYTDVVNTPCTHVRYFYYVDTTGAFLRQSVEDISDWGDFTQPKFIHFRAGSDVYFTDAANLNSLTATDGEYPDRVLLTWELTEGGTNTFSVETRPDSASNWTLLGTTTDAYWNDQLADPSVSSEWQYRVTMSYNCNGNMVTDSRTTTGSRSPWGQVSGRVHYEDGSGCPGVTVVATRTSDGATIQTVITDESGAYLLDSLPYGGGVEYTITPTSQTAQFRYNNTSSGFATVNLSLAHCISNGIDFDNISSVRFTGRVLYEKSSIPVRDANFRLNGNRTVSPSMWQVFVNKNVLLWNSDGINKIFYEQADRETEIPVQIMNVSGRRHQYTIDGLPDWLNVSQAYGSINPQETQTLVFTVDEDLAVGVYSEIIYLTDENDLSEPLKVLIEVKATCPWVDVNSHNFNHQMSLLGQVMVDGVIDTDPNDVVVAISNGQYVGFQHISYDNDIYPGYLFMTIYSDTNRGSESLKFRLWQASTGRIFGLTPSQTIMFESNAMVGMPPASPVILYTTANEVQNIDLNEGWNWVSFNIAPNDDGALDGLFFTTSTPFTEGDQLKSVATQQFAEWDGTHWMGSLTALVPGEGYLLYRNGTDTVPFTFHNVSKAMGSKGISDEKPMLKSDIVRPATNMTIIASIENEELRMRAKEGGLLKAYTGEKLTGVAEWLEVDGEMLFFLNVGTDDPGQLNFFLEENGTKTELFANIPLQAVANRHFGSLDNPVLLSLESNLLASNFQAYPTVFTDHVDFEVTNIASKDVHIVIRNAAGMTVDEINTLHWTNCEKLSAGVYFATLYAKDYTATVKLIKVNR